MSFCSHCGHRLEDAVRFCARCGTAIAGFGADPASPPPSTATAAIAMEMPASMFDLPPVPAWEKPSASTPAAPFSPSSASPLSAASPASDGLALWTPMVAVYASFFLTPLFGGWIHAKNWHALHQPERAKNAMQWSIAVFLVEWIAGLALPVPKHPLSAFLVALLPSVIGLVFWYVYMAKEQVEYVAHLPHGYEKKRWAQPVWRAIGLMILFTLGLIALSIIAIATGLAEAPK